VRIQLISDLHFEFHRDGGAEFARNMPIAGDVIVIAGDLLPLVDLEATYRTFGWFCQRVAHVVFVPGNHEYYGTSPANADTLLNACARHLPNLHVLNPGVAAIDGVRFVGAALWFPPTPDEAKYRLLLNDFGQIGGFVPWVHQTHAAHLAFLTSNVRRGDVVVTHNMPHPRSVAAEYVGSPMNRFFLSEDAADLVEHGGARLWIHGHTHIPCDYAVGETRVVCNPYGYPGETARAYDAGRVVEVLDVTR
jgi:Icc-related predicted phosphoesterase